MCIRRKTKERLGDPRTEMFNVPVQQHPTSKPTKQIPITVIITIHQTICFSSAKKIKIIKYSRTALCRQVQRFYLSNETSKD